MQDDVMSLMRRPIRFLFIALAGLSLLAALWSGLGRLGWDLPQPNVDFRSYHGPLMVIGFLGTLIGLERAAAVERWWVYGAPLLSVLSIASLLLGDQQRWPALLALGASLLLVGFFYDLHRRQPSEHFLVLSISATALSVGNMIWLAEAPIPQVVPWWTGFLVLMIAGERLELTRLRRPSVLVRAQFRVAIAIVLLGLLLSVFAFFPGARVTGAGLLALALWLLRYDLAWQNLSQPGLPSFMARCLIAGYFWLAAGAALWLWHATSFAAGPIYDAMLHAIFVGFVFSMIFAHAPIILPSITGLPLPFHRFFYAHAVLLHASLALRIAGDLIPLLWAQKWGGLLNALSILLFLLNNIRAVNSANRIHPV
jgi:hypothetical protein